jgi:hypothetical protein
VHGGSSDKIVFFFLDVSRFILTELNQTIAFDQLRIKFSLYIRIGKSLHLHNIRKITLIVYAVDHQTLFSRVLKRIKLRLHCRLISVRTMFTILNGLFTNLYVILLLCREVFHVFQILAIVSVELMTVSCVKHCVVYYVPAWRWRPNCNLTQENSLEMKLSAFRCNRRFFA